MLPGGMYVAVEKETLKGGTVEELKQFIDEKRKAANSLADGSGKGTHGE